MTEATLSSRAIELYAQSPVDGEFKPSGVFYCSNCKCVEKHAKMIDNDAHFCVRKISPKFPCAVCGCECYSLHEDRYCSDCFDDVKADRGDLKVIPEEDIPDHPYCLNIDDEYFDDMYLLMESVHDDCYNPDLFDEKEQTMGVYEKHKRPRYARIAEPEEQSLSAERIVENSLDDFYEDAFEGVSGESIQELQVLLDGWLKTYGLTCYRATKTRVRIPWEEWDKEFEGVNDD